MGFGVESVHSIEKPLLRCQQMTLDVLCLSLASNINEEHELALSKKVIKELENVSPYVGPIDDHISLGLLLQSQGAWWRFRLGFEPCLKLAENLTEQHDD